MAEVEIEDAVEQGFATFGFPAQALLFHDVQADDAEVADVVADEARNIVVADKQQVDRHVFAETEQLILALDELQSATLEQVAASDRSDVRIFCTAILMRCSLDSMHDCP